MHDKLFPELHQAVMDNDIDVVKKCLERGDDPNEHYGEYPLRLALYDKTPQILEMLLEYGASTFLLDLKNEGRRRLSHIQPDLLDELMKHFDKQDIQTMPTVKDIFSKLKPKIEHAKMIGKKPLILLGEYHHTFLLSSIERHLLQAIFSNTDLAKFYLELPSNKDKNDLKFYFTWGFGVDFSDKLMLIDSPRSEKFKNYKPGVDKDLDDERDHYMADKINQTNKAGVAIVGAAHLKGLCEYIDHTKFHVIPINLLNIMHNCADKILHDRYVEFIAQVLDSDNSRRCFAFESPQVMQPQFVASKKRKRSDEQDTEQTEKAVKQARLEPPVAYMPAFSRQLRRTITAICEINDPKPSLVSRFCNVM